MSAYLLKNYYNFSDFDNCIYNITMFPYCYETESEWMCGNFDIYLFGDITPTIEWLKNNVNTFNINGDKILRIYDHHATKFNEIFNFKESDYKKIKKLPEMRGLEKKVLIHWYQKQPF